MNTRSGRSSSSTRTGQSINLACSHLDPDQIVAGGYCTEDCGEYWKDLVTAAVYER